MKMTEYRINTFWSKNDGGYIGTSPEFDGIAVWGQTRQEAVAEAESAIAAYIEIYERDGRSRSTDRSIAGPN